MVAGDVGHAPAALCWARQRLMRVWRGAATSNGDYHRRMTPCARSNMLAVAAHHASASLVLGAHAANARGATNVQALAFAPTRLAPACQPLHAMRGLLSRMQFLRKVRCGRPAWLALAKAASVNRSMHTDTQVLAASRLRFQGAGDFRRYEAWR